MGTHLTDPTHHRAQPVVVGARRGLLLGGAMAAASAASLALVAPYHAAAPSTVQGEGTDWHLGYYAALAVVFARAVAVEVRWPSPPRGRAMMDTKTPPAHCCRCV